MISDKTKKIILTFFIVPIFIPLLIIFIFNYINDKPLLSFKDVESPNWIVKGETMGGIPWNITINSKYVDTLILRQKVNSILTDFNNIASTYIDDSEITKLNQSQLGSIHLSAELCYLLDKSIEYCDLSDGYYDVTVMPLVNLWNFGYENNDLEYPTTMQVNQALKHVNCRQLSLLKCNLQKNQNMNIDLSSIAKGYAVDIVSEFLTNFGFNNHIVEIGGELRVNGFSNGKNWIVGILDPINSDSLLSTIAITDKSVASSGTYNNYFIEDGVKYSHIINPKTGYPIKVNILGSTVIAEKCIDADALATIAMLIPPLESIKIFKSLDVEGVITAVNQNNETVLYKSKGFDDYLKK